jgi:hypothetical protein
MFCFLSKGSAVSVDGICADHVLQFNAGDGTDWKLDFESRGRIVDVICETLFYNRDITDEIHGCTCNAMPGTDGEGFNRKTIDDYR